jgi:nucleoside-diphosphate-sugar epimerase
LGEAPGVAGTFNVATGVPHEIGAAIELLRGRAACHLAVETVDPAHGAGDVSTQTGDPGRLQRATGWAPSHSFDESLQALLDSWRTRTRRGAFR